jgi:hypothetical protein
LVDVDTIRYSVPHRLVRYDVDVVVDDPAAGKEGDCDKRALDGGSDQT